MAEETENTEAKSGLLVLNAGSSSLKFALYGIEDDLEIPAPLLRGQVAGIGGSPTFKAERLASGGEVVARDLGPGEADSHRDAIALVLDWVDEHSGDVALIGAGHRVVHGGGRRNAPARVTDDLLGELDTLCPLAPHHQPHNLAAIRALAAVAPDLPQVACFDTAFHATQPEVARLLPLPAELRARNLQRYGFHGLSYEYITGAMARAGDGRLPSRLIVAHLGNGASVCAIRDGRSVATSMGFSTLDGLLMGTRCGTLDPGVLLHLMREEGMDEAALSDLLYNRSGLLGVSGISADMQKLLASDAPAARDAVELFCYTLVRAIGSMAAALQGADALVFTGGIGEHAAEIRARVCRQLGWLGLDFDETANEVGADPLSLPVSRVEVRVIPTDEERIIAEHTLRIVRNRAVTSADGRR